MKFTRTLQELESVAVKWWPEHLKKAESEASIIPLLLETQERFISILSLSVEGKPESIVDIIKAACFPMNLFLKHLAVLTDFGAEPLQRVNRDFMKIFPKGVLEFSIGGNAYAYAFRALPVSGTLNNKKMRIDAAGLSKESRTDVFCEDIIMLLLYAGNSVDPDKAGLFSKCIVGNMLGNKTELIKYIKQRYICVSRITGGSQANDLGNAAQEHVAEYLKKRLGKGYEFTSRIPGVTQNDGRTLTAFDLVVSRNGKYVAIEISFQVTTNSTIERKGGQARERFASIAGSGNFIAYIIDGAGNFQRKSALTTICENSHCTVAYSDKEFDVLVAFIKGKME